jgi:AcrR family transcriptional regulator
MITCVDFLQLSLHSSCLDYKNINMETSVRDRILEAYIDHLLMKGHQPATVYAFCKELGIEETEFYKHYASFAAIAQDVWFSHYEDTIQTIKKHDLWMGYTVREKFLSFFFTYFEGLQKKRSFYLAQIKQSKSDLRLFTPVFLKKVKEAFEQFSNDLVNEGIASNEIKDRTAITSRYKDALWIQFIFLLNYWVNDDSPGFERTDEAIEKGVQVTLDMMGHSPLDNLVEYGKFIFKNAGKAF